MGLGSQLGFPQDIPCGFPAGIPHGAATGLVPRMGWDLVEIFLTSGSRRPRRTGRCIDRRLRPPCWLLGSTSCQRPPIRRPLHSSQVALLHTALLVAVSTVMLKRRRRCCRRTHTRRCRRGRCPGSGSGFVGLVARCE